MLRRICPHCQQSGNSEFIKCSCCKRLSHVAIVMTGPVLSMKSVVANYLHRFLKIGVVESAYYGPAIFKSRTDEELRRMRQIRVLKAARIFAEANLPVIVDAAFHRRKDRLRFARQFRAGMRSDLVVLCCHSRDPQLREFRRLHRNKDRLPFEVERQYKKDADQLLRIYEEPTKQEPYPSLHFDPDRNTARLCNLSVARPEIQELLNQLLETVLYGAAIGWR